MLGMIRVGMVVSSSTSFPSSGGIQGKSQVGRSVVVRDRLPRVVPAECMVYLTPDCSISRWTSAIWAETEAEPVPIWGL